MRVSLLDTKGPTERCLPRVLWIDKNLLVNSGQVDAVDQTGIVQEILD